MNIELIIFDNGVGVLLITLLDFFLGVSNEVEATVLELLLFLLVAG